MNMSLFEPIKFAIKKIEYLPPLQRTLAIYKNPSFNNYPFYIYQHELIDLVMSLILSQLIILSILQIFPNYFYFDPFKIFYMIPLTIYFVANALSIAIFIGIFSTAAFIIFNKKISSDLFSMVVWRTVRLFSIINFFIIFIALICENDIFKFGSIHSNGIFIDLLLIAVLIGIPFILGLRVLVFPLIKAISIRRVSIRVASVLCIFLFAFKLNGLIFGFVPSTILFNKKEIEQEIYASIGSGQVHSL